MNWLLLLTVVVLALATYFSALHLALLTYSRAAMERYLEARGQAALGDWLTKHLDSATLAVSFVRTVTRVTFMVVVLLDVVRFPEHRELTITRVLIAAGIAIVLLWLCGAVIGQAVARHASVGLIATALPLVRLLTLLCLPFIKALAFVDEAVRRLTGSTASDAELSEAELLRSIEETQREGVLDEGAATMLENVVEFASTDVAEVMTPRTDIEGIELTDDLAAIRQFIVDAGHSRIPVYRDNLDNIVGILYVKDLMPYLGEDASGFCLEPILHPPLIVPETKPVRELLTDFQRSEVHLAIIVDEYGGTEGLVTIEDVLEEIVGEIHDEHEPDDEEEPSLDRLDAAHAEVDGRYHIDDLNEALGLDIPEEEEYDTVAGFVLAQLGRVPAQGESFEAFGARFTIIATTPTHIQRIGIELPEAAGGAHGDDKDSARRLDAGEA